MKRPKTISGLAALTLGIGLAGGVALAADYDRRDHRDRGENTQQNDQNDDHDQGDRRKRHGDRGQDTQQQQQQPQPQQTNVEDRRNDDRDRSDRSRDNDNDHRNWGSNNDRWRQNLDHRRDNRRFGWDRYRRSWNSPQRFSIGVYHAPSGYYYRRWHHGERLPRAFYVRDYWLTNFFLFGLFAPPSDDLIWVRYGPDALLIDRYTGEIVQVRYNAFY